jgi:hypothetical protein
VSGGYDGKIFSYRVSGRVSDILSAIAGAGAWIAIVVICSFSFMGREPLAPGLPAPLVIGGGVIGVALNAVVLARQIYGKRVTLDSALRIITISRLFGGKTVMTFESVERVAPVTFRTFFTRREAYCVAPTIAPIFGAKIISPVGAPRGSKMRRFKSEILPIIEKTLDLERVEPQKHDNELVIVPYGYKVRDRRYTKSFFGRYFWMCALSALLAVGLMCERKFGALNNFTVSPPAYKALFTAIAALAVIMAMMWLFVMVMSVTFDVLKGEIVERRGAFGWGGSKIYKMSSVRSFAVREYGSGMDEERARSVYLELEGARRQIPVIYSASRGKRMSDEMRFLARILGIDQTRDVTYTLCRYIGTLLEVP